jgi:hypothetical protein
MPRHKDKLVASASESPELIEPLRKAMLKRAKADLVEALVEVARADRGLLRQLAARFDVSASPVDLVAATRRAIADATAFNEREINRNFAYDHAAYKEIKRNMGVLIQAGQLLLVMDLSLELMKRGSYQVEMSDEGMMTQDLEGCLGVVLAALRKSELPADKVIGWCSAMRKSDCVGFIATEQLQSLSGFFKKSAALNDRKE